MFRILRVLLPSFVLFFYSCAARALFATAFFEMYSTYNSLIRDAHEKKKKRNTFRGVSSAIKDTPFFRVLTDAILRVLNFDLEPVWRSKFTKILARSSLENFLFKSFVYRRNDAMEKEFWRHTPGTGYAQQNRKHRVGRMVPERHINVCSTNAAALSKNLKLRIRAPPRSIRCLARRLRSILRLDR